MFHSLLGGRGGILVPRYAPDIAKSETMKVRDAETELRPWSQRQTNLGKKNNNCCIGVTHPIIAY